MKTITSVVIAALMLGLVACGQEGSGATKADGSAAAATTATQGVTFVARPDLAESVEALPRLAGDSPAIVAINADLENRDAEARAGGCDGGGGFERGVMQPMTGPGYITFWISEGYYCDGAAHPSFDQTALTYDLATGQPVDWVAAAPGLQLTRGDTTDMPATYVPPVSSTVLTTWYSRKMLASTDTERLGDCGDVWTVESIADSSFRIWLNAQDGGLSVAPDFAHVIQACADSATLTPAEMREFGVSQAMIDAVTAAHTAGNWAPKE